VQKIAALIPAAGYSSRMGLFKPLLPLSSSALVLEQAVETFRAAGIGEIYVVTGHKADVLGPLLERLQVQPVWNVNYKHGMYSSIRAGVQALAEGLDAFFLLPADCPFVSAATIRRLATAAGKIASQDCDVVYPVYQGKRGHPPLISTRLLPLIIEREFAGGLRGLLQARSSMEVPVGDAGILRDLDTEGDYQKALPPELPPYPSGELCERVWAEQNTPAPLIRHMRKVAAVGETIAEHLNSRGARIHLGLVKAACLVHDIARGEKDHPAKGRQIVAALGYPAAAEIIACHMELPEEYARGINACSLVYLADKMVRGDRLVTLEARREEMLARHQDDAAAREAIERRMATALRIRDQVERITGPVWEHLVE